MIVAGLIITGYFLFSLINYLYSKNGKGIMHGSEVKVIAILSGDFIWDTVARLNRGLELRKKFPEAIIVICGRKRAIFMRSYLARHGLRKVVVQDQSTNTYEDAKFLFDLLSPDLRTNLALVTSSPHQRRANHTFKKVFTGNIYNFPTDDFFNWYSPVFLGGWLANLINIYRDWKYNGKIW